MSEGLSKTFILSKKGMAGPTGLEPATSDVTGQRSNQLNYGPAWYTFEEVVGGDGLEPSASCL